MQTTPNAPSPWQTQVARPCLEHKKASCDIGIENDSFRNPDYFSLHDLVRAGCPPAWLQSAVRCRIPPATHDVGWRTTLLASTPADIFLTHRRSAAHLDGLGKVGTQHCPNCGQQLWKYRTDWHCCQRNLAHGLAGAHCGSRVNESWAKRPAFLDAGGIKP